MCILLSLAQNTAAGSPFFNVLPFKNTGQNASSEMSTVHILFYERLEE